MQQNFIRGAHSHAASSISSSCSPLRLTGLAFIDEEVLAASAAGSSASRATPRSRRVPRPARWLHSRRLSQT